MGTLVKTKQPCLSQECGSSDARGIYADGSSFCFSCRRRFPKSAYSEPAESGEEDEFVAEDAGSKLEEIATYPMRGFKERQIKKEIAEFFQVRVSYTTLSDGLRHIAEHYYPYEGGKAYKVRALPKQFRWIGKSEALFGMERFSGGGKRVVITEGEIDAMTVAAASLAYYNQIYPVVALSSAVMAETSLMHARSWLRSFAEVVLCLDADEPGEKAKQIAIRVIGADKVKIATLPAKDPNEVWLASNQDETLMKAIFAAQPYTPERILRAAALKKAGMEFGTKPAILYPACMSGINTKTDGMHESELALFVAGTGVGKSTLTREIVLEMLDKHKQHKVGVVSLEEPPGETISRLAAAKSCVNFRNWKPSEADRETAIDAILENDRLLVLDHQGSFKDSSIVDNIEYMALSGCRVIVLDHFTILVSEGAAGLDGNKAEDKVMNDLARLLVRYPGITLVMIAHLRKTGVEGAGFEAGRMPKLDDIKGSGSIKQISKTIVGFSRNTEADELAERCLVKVSVLKCRDTGDSGPCDGMVFDSKTGRLQLAPREQADAFTKEDITAL